jgi:hypothetical protein
LDINQADRDIRTAQRNLADALKDPNRTADTVAQAQDDLSRAVVRRADVEVEQANRVREAQTGQAIDATEKANIYNQSIDNQALKIGNVGTQVDNLKIKLDGLPTELNIKINAELPGAAWNTVKKVFGFGQGGDSTSTQDPNRDPVTGGRATGGPVKGGIYEVNENGTPESVTLNGRQYLLVPPGQSGNVSPLSQLGGNGLPPGAQILDDIGDYAWNYTGPHGNVAFEHDQAHAGGVGAEHLIGYTDGSFSTTPINVYISNPEPMAAAREVAHSLLQAAPGLHGRQAA